MSRGGSVVIGALRAVPIAVVLAHLAVAAAIVTVAPSSGLLGSVARMTIVDPGAWLLLPTAVVSLYWALRPPTDAAVAVWLQRRDLPARLAPHAAKEIERVRRWRVIPTLAVSLFGPARGTAYNLAIAEHDPEGATAGEFLSAASSGGLAGTLVPVVAAYLFGVAAAELTRRAPAFGDGVPTARLEVRRPASYLVPRARGLPWLAAAVVLALTGLRALVGGEVDARWSGVTTAAMLVATAVTLALGPALQRWVVRRSQRVADEAALAFDDVARSSTAHAIAAATTVALLALASAVVTDLWNASLDGSRILTWALVPIGIALLVGTFGIWQPYGSAHPGMRPGRGQPT